MALYSSPKRRRKSAAGFKGSGNRRFKQVARKYGSRGGVARRAAGALHKSRAQRTPAERRAIRRTRGLRTAIRRAPSTAKLFKAPRRGRRSLTKKWAKRARRF